MCSRSSNRPPVRPLAIGSVAGHRGTRGELTVRMASGEAAPWAAVTEFVLRSKDGGHERRMEVESARAYRDRLVLKLKEVDTPEAAEAMRGWSVLAPEEQVPDLPEGRYYAQRLIGLEIRNEADALLGTVTDVLESGGNDVMVVVGPQGDEWFVPVARAFVLRVDESAGQVVVRLVDGLRDLNRPGKDGR